jgi:hypothetical protein
MLLATDFAVILCRHFEELQAAVGSEEAALVAQSLHLGGRERFEVYRDFEILVEDLHGVHAADGGGHGKAHGVAESLFGGDCAVAHEFAATSQAFHTKSGDAAAGGFGQDLGFEAAKSGVATIERHLHGVEGEIVGQHAEMNFGILVTGEAEEADLALLPGGDKSFGDAVGGED